MFKTFSLSKNKRIEIDIGKPYRFIKIIDFHISWTRNTDHAGFDFLISLFGQLYCQIVIYDIRNWNDKKKCWEFNSYNR